MAILFLYLGAFLIFVFSLKIKNKEDASILDKNFSNSLKTLFIFLIVLSHILGALSYNGVLSKPLALFRFAMGQMCVTPFFLISGFGLFEGYKKYGNSYNKKVFLNHFLKILMFTAICLVPYLIYDLLVNGTKPFYVYPLAFIGLTNLGNQNWFIFAILFVYLFTFLVGLLKIKNNYWNLLIITLGCVAYIVAFRLLGYGSYWYDTILAFPVGILFSINKAKIEKWLSKKSVPIILFFVSIILYVLWKLLCEKFAIIRDFHALYSLPLIVFVSIGIVCASKIFTARNNLLVFFGINSWPLFLMHMLPILLLKPLGMNDSVFYILSFVASLVLSIPFALLFKLIEKKIFKRFA